MWELNRRTGKVIVFANPAKRRTAWQVAHELPFDEFDCYLQSTPSPQGLPQFNLSLVHYREEAHVALVGMFGATKQPCRAARRLGYGSALYGHLPAIAGDSGVRDLPPTRPGHHRA
ncbi:hypothetical protein [Litchfieldella anticariensis]|nr:hypothetical protein [Halomonas anticariensis]